MRIYERSVTQPYWEPVYRYLAKRWRPTFRQIGDVTMLHGTGKGQRIYYAIFRNSRYGPRPAGWLILRQRLGWWAWEVEQLWVFPAFRGQGMAKQLYKAAIDGDNLIVASGKTHTKYSKGLWESFIRKGTFNIWAHDFQNVSRWCPVIWDAGEVYSRISLYDTGGLYDTINQDMRLMALKGSS
jgi:hypothetical protein